MINFDDDEMRLLSGKTDKELLEAARFHNFLLWHFASAGWILLLGTVWASLR